MTLLVCLTGKDGIVLASDSRATFGDPRGITAQNDTLRKLFKIHKHTGLLTAGSGELGSMLLKDIDPEIQSLADKNTTTIMLKVREITKRKYDEWFSRFHVREHPMEPHMTRPPLSLMVVGYDFEKKNSKSRMYSLISELDFAPLLHDYGFAIQGVPQYALYLLNRLYSNDMNVKNLKALAAYVIQETAAQDGKVGGPIQMATIIPSTGFKAVSKKEIETIKRFNEQIRNELKKVF